MLYEVITFYFNALIIGRYCEQQWGKAPQPLPSRFRYPIMADPQLVEFFPPVRADETDADQLGVILQDAVEALSVSIVDPAILEELRINHVWILGGPMTPSLLARMREHTGTLHTLASRITSYNVCYTKLLRSISNLVKTVIIYL